MRAVREVTVAVATTLESLSGDLVVLEGRRNSWVMAAKVSERSATVAESRRREASGACEKKTD